ncbi:hypothetical protein E3A20_28470, partial [Planctomyces bekefii]
MNDGKKLVTGSRELPKATASHRRILCAADAIDEQCARMAC